MLIPRILTDSELIFLTLRFLRYRKLIGRVIGTRGSIVKFQPTEDYQATMFLKRVLDSPGQLDQVHPTQYAMLW